MRRPSDPTTVVAYVRVSTDRQALGPEVQRAEISAYAASNGLTIASWHEDIGVSGAAPIESRPGLLCALAAVRQHRAGVLLVSKRDRLARDVVVARLTERALERDGAVVASADGNGNGIGPADVMLRTILDSVSEYERALIRMRTKAALAQKKARGERLGGLLPYGHRVADDGKTLVPHAEEQALLTQVRTLAAEGLSQRGIVARLAALGTVGRSGAPLGKTQIARMLAA